MNTLKITQIGNSLGSEPREEGVAAEGEVE